MDTIAALIAHHTRGTFTPPPSAEVTAYERRVAAQERFDAVGLPRCLAPIAAL